MEQHNINMSSTSNSNLPSADPLEGKRTEICLPLYKASMKGDWEAAKDILDKHGLELVRHSISKNFETALHVAVSRKKISFVKELVPLMGDKDLELRNSNSETALFIAARTGNVDMAKVLVAKNLRLPQIPGYQGLMPLHVAVLFKNYDMVSYLYTDCCGMDGDAWTNESRGGVLLACVETEFFDTALKIVEDHPDQLAFSGGNVLRALAQKSRVFNPRKYMKLYDIIEMKNLNLSAKVVAAIPTFVRPLYAPHFAKEKQRMAIRLLNKVLEKIMTLPLAKFDDIMRGPGENTTSMIRYPSRVLFLATEMGNTRFLIELIKKYPEIVREVNDLNQSIFHVAVLHRHRAIFNRLFNTGFAKDHMILLEDENGNNMLHLAAMVQVTENAYEEISFQSIVGVGIQMRQEWKWFKNVAEMLPPHYGQKKNKDGLTPRQVFTKEHKDMVSNGEKWMKETASQMMVVAALIATISFAAAITFAGGYDQTSGNPVFIKKDLFKTFLVLTSIAFACSSTSIITILSLLTSRYTEYDFYLKLPIKFGRSLVFLSASILFMMASFSLNLFLLFDSRSKKIPIFVCFLLYLMIFFLSEFLGLVTFITGLSLLDFYRIVGGEIYHVHI